MQTIDRLPDGDFIIGAREIAKAASAGKVKRVVAAANCPGVLIDKLPAGVELLRFAGDQKEMGTKLGKPFSVAMAGYK